MDDCVTSFQETCLDLVAAVFLFSGGGKAFGLRSFREGLIFIPYMRVSWSHLVGWTLPAAELAVAAGLYLNLQAAKVAALALLALFCGVVALVLWKRLKVPCGCFAGLGDRYLSPGNLRDNGLLALAVVMTLSLDSRSHVAEGLLLAGFLLLFYLAAGELARQQRFLAGLRKQGVL